MMPSPWRPSLTRYVRGERARGMAALPVRGQKTRRCVGQQQSLPIAEAHTMRSKRVTLAFLGTAAALCSLVMAARAEEPATQAVSLTSRPNIIWISNEDMSQRLGVYGDKLARTPVLDRLARESIRYTTVFATAPVCAPSRAAIITGMYQTTLGAQHMRTTEDRVPTSWERASPSCWDFPLT